MCCLKHHVGWSNQYYCFFCNKLWLCTYLYMCVNTCICPPSGNQTWLGNHQKIEVYSWEHHRTSHLWLPNCVCVYIYIYIIYIHNNQCPFLTVYLTIRRKALKCIHRPQDIQVLVDNEVVASLQGCETREDWYRILICLRKMVIWVQWKWWLKLGNMVDNGDFIRILCFS